ncbi:hypothetical protein [Paenarthrobacter ureafaciens]|uniref:hypothetical protein n=1 Tax=Paenarthrobacter ureafaciens TaxID=37931 RepID=UPI001FB4504A|nr:hypothetical protein [Paenarthrobacter ureafaciens]UOD80312.1 hypothetical protein MQZ73_14485 [Paenarthrobacter ureafaciens]WNZ04338.1 hypothetical protein PVT25_01905 [Paenarthrobacter ureafaciens]
MSDYTACDCRGTNECGDCGLHGCTDCICDVDGAPQSREEVTAGGYVNPSTARLEAWANKRELTR